MATRSPKATAVRRTRRSFVLSEDVLDFLEAEKEKRHNGSVSVVLEDLIREYSRRSEPTKAAASIIKYYNSLSSEEQQESRSWGEFAESQFPTD
jgi:hypothetical protein